MQLNLKRVNAVQNHVHVYTSYNLQPLLERKVDLWAMLEKKSYRIYLVHSVIHKRFSLLF